MNALTDQEGDPSSKQGPKRRLNFGFVFEAYQAATVLQAAYGVGGGDNNEREAEAVSDHIWRTKNLINKILIS